MRLLISVVRPIASVLTVAFAMLVAVTIGFAIVGFLEEGQRGAVDGVFVALLAAVAYLPAALGGGLLWALVLLAARRVSEEARVLAIALSPLSFLVLYLLWRWTLPGPSRSLDWTLVALFAPIMMACSGLFLFVDRRWEGTGLFSLLGVVVGLSALFVWGYLKVLSGFG